ncbi:MAG: hypothetical protein J5895_02245 [Alphaproteobacteria bacterium]|nr:hypothetical protein [Alphaproteobacteria bacterium]
MRKFIALKNAVYYSVEIDGDKTRFFANKQGTGYDTRVDVTPSVLPNKILINEIFERQTISSEMSEKLDEFVAELEENYNKVGA